MRRFLAALIATALAAPHAGAARPAPRPHSVVLFVAGGMRPGLVNPQDTPAMAALLRHGVRFAGAHAVVPPLALPNAAAFATGMAPSATGLVANTIDAGFPVAAAAGNPVVSPSDAAILTELEAHFSGSAFTRAPIMSQARHLGIATASIGKAGPTLLFDRGAGALLIDDATGHDGGAPLAPEIAKRLAAAGLPSAAPARGANGTSGTTVANTAQQDYFLAIVTRVVLPLMKERGKPFFLAFWSRDPDGTQHNQDDGHGHLLPGIDGPTSQAGRRNADSDLAGILAALRLQGLDATTDVILASDHGASTISKESATSFAATQTYRDIPPGTLPPGFLAVDLAHGLKMSMLDPDDGAALVHAGGYPSHGNALIGGDKGHPKIIVAANGGSDLIYLPGGDAALAQSIVTLLAGEDYVSGLFVADGFGPIPGTLPLSALGLRAAAGLPAPSLPLPSIPPPSILVNFRSFSTGCANPDDCAAEIADTGRKQGQGASGSLSAADLSTLGGAIGPDFKRGYTDPSPTSTADLGRTIAHILGLTPLGLTPEAGDAGGRVLEEAMPGGHAPPMRHVRHVSKPDGAGRVTAVDAHIAGGETYIEAAGYPGSTLGLAPLTAP